MGGGGGGGGVRRDRGPTSFSVAPFSGAWCETSRNVAP